MSETGVGGRTSARAAVWAFLSTAGAKLVTLIGLTILARILAPAEFGLLAFAMAYIVYAETIGDLGSGAALIYWPDRRDDAAQVTFLVNLAAGTFWCVTTILIAPLVADFFNAPQGVAIVRVLGLSFLIKYLGNTHDALAIKDLRFRSRALPEIGLAVLKGVISVVLASFGFGAWSLVWGHLGGLAIWTILLWLIVPWRPTLRIPRELFQPMLHYGRGIIMVNVLSSIISHADLAVVGRMLDLATLGLYQMATKVPEATITIVARIVGKVLFPTFARIAATGASLDRAYVTATRYVAAVTLPMVAGLVVLAPQIVAVTFGPKWAGAAPIVRALAVLVGIRSLTNPIGSVMKGTGQARRLAQLEAVRAALIVPAMIVGARWGGAGVAAASAVADGIANLIGYSWLSRSIGLHVGPAVRALVPSVLSSTAMALGVAAWVGWGPPLSNGPMLASGVIIGAVLYVAALRLADPEMLRNARALLLHRTTPMEETAR